jgi:two-component system, chemotaxis family, response regulator Rcp1
MNTVTNTQPAEILLVEDNDNDVELTNWALKKAKLAINLHRVKDGVECMAFLRKQGEYAAMPTPDLILLDLNMPRKGGREVMQEMVADELLRSIPVVILTTSEDEKEILSLYKLRCSSYIVKPVDFAQFTRVIQTMADYWFTVVVLPVGPFTGKAGADISPKSSSIETSV